MTKKKRIPIFYAADEKYMPYLAVALASLKEYKSADYEYRVHVLYTGDLNGRATKIRKMAEENFFIEFHDVTEKLDRIADCMVCRDYYTTAIYYRLMIPELFPQYDKVLYMDCDTVALTDIAELYLCDIGENYIGAVADQAVAAVPQFRAYTHSALGIKAEEYFNSGVIVMNLKKFREIHFYERFSRILRSYHFTIAPDQDVLNLICKGRVHYLDGVWNRMPIAGEENEIPKIVHYNLTMKPWHYDGILYEEYFWAFAEKTEFLEEINNTKAAFTEEMVRRDKESGIRLISLAQSEAESNKNFLCSVGYSF